MLANCSVLLESLNRRDHSGDLGADGSLDIEMNLKEFECKLI
jgi:hypothetical protein